MIALFCLRGCCSRRLGGGIRNMNGKVIALVGALSVIVASSELMAQSCPCPKLGFDEVVKTADAIFVGRALSATNDSGAPTGNSTTGWKEAGVEYQTRLTFDVQKVIKGNPPRFVEVITPVGSCGFGFSVGERYLVIGVGRGAAVATDSCKGNRSGSEPIEAQTATIEKLLRADDR
jgi:hypothetical protein